MRNDFESNYLAHHGILGQKWGDQNGPPYPLDAKDHSAKEKKAGWIKSLKEKGKAKKLKKQRMKNLEKARKAREEKKKQEEKQKKFDEEKQKILRSGNAKEVAKYKGQMTNQELRDALNRIQWEKELDKHIPNDPTLMDKVDGLMDKVGTMTGWVNKGVSAYEAINKAMKIINGEEGKFDKIIDEGDISKIKANEQDMSPAELKKAWENYNLRKKVRES